MECNHCLTWPLDACQKLFSFMDVLKRSFWFVNGTVAQYGEDGNYKDRHSHSSAQGRSWLMGTLMAQAWPFHYFVFHESLCFVAFIGKRKLEQYNMNMKSWMGSISKFSCSGMWYSYFNELFSEHTVLQTSAWDECPSSWKDYHMCRTFKGLPVSDFSKEERISESTTELYTLFFFITIL